METIPSSFEPKKPAKKGISFGLFVSLLCVLLSASVLTTYYFTSGYLQKKQKEILEQEEKTIDSLKEQLANSALSAEEDPFGKLNFLSRLFLQSSYYSGDVSDEDLLNAVLHAYAEATGDDYAQYYTEEEYAKIAADAKGESSGIGIGVVQEKVTVDSSVIPVYHVVSVFQNTPAEQGGILPGDLIVGIFDENGELLTISAMGGFTGALSRMRGSLGTAAKFRVLRPNGVGYDPIDFEIERVTYTKQSVTSKTAEGDPATAIIRINEFDYTTPEQLKNTVKTNLAEGVSHFVLDLRNNPGGNLESILSVLSFFLQKDDLILSKVNRAGETGQSYFAGSATYAYAPGCNVTEEEIGMFASLDTVVLCNENTASAAEVFVAAMRDYSICKTVGTKTFGKGIIQSMLSLSSASNGKYDGYAKMTTYAYVTKCGVSYHGIGITPDETVVLSETAQSYSFFLMPQSEDNQLQKALEMLHN